MPQSKSNRNQTLICLGGSICLHVFLLSFFPGLAFEIAPAQEILTPVSVIEWIRIPTAALSVDAGRKTSDEDAGPWREEIKGQAEALQKGMTELDEAAAITLPRSLMERENEQMKKEMERTLANEPPPVNLTANMRPTGESNALMRSDLFSRGTAGSMPEPSRFGFDFVPVEPSLNKRKADEKTAGKDPFGLTGPIVESKRKVVFRPDLPEAPPGHSAKIKLKFWVDSSGIVGRIVPETKGDSLLEKAAIQFLKGWRFERAESSGRNQWGVITIDFR